MIMLLILGFAASLYCLRFFYKLAATALPVYASLTTAFLLDQLGAGPVMSCLAGFVLGVGVMQASRSLVLHAKSPVTQAMVKIAVIFPAALAGYQLTLGIARLAIGSNALLRVLGLVGAVIVGRLAWTRLVHPRLL